MYLCKLVNGVFLGESRSVEAGAGVPPGWVLSETLPQVGQGWAGKGWCAADPTFVQSVIPRPGLADFVAALDNLYDSEAKTRRYDNRYTCALRAGFPGPFQSEGLAFASWMDTCNALGYQILAAVEAGSRPAPTIPELLAELPPMEWPV